MTRKPSKEALNEAADFLSPKYLEIQLGNTILNKMKESLALMIDSIREEERERCILLQKERLEIDRFYASSKKMQKKMMTTIRTSGRGR
jgi:hypothetical protein